jgi:hypothetical protein
MAQALRGLINSGFNRQFAACVMNAPVKDGGYEPREFSTWAPLALAGIGHLPDTVRDRSIEIEMQRKLPTESVKKLRRRDGADLDDLARKITRWAADSLEALRDAEPEMPDGLNDRAADAWEPLIAIADLIGGECPSRARKAALALSGDDVAAEKDENTDTMLLADIRAAFDHFGVDTISSEDLTDHLVAIEGRPWAEWRNGKPISKHQLSRRLKEYRIVSGTIRTADGTPKGYHRSAFEEAFLRYLPGPPVSTRHIATPLEKQGEPGNFELATRQPCGEFKNQGNARMPGVVAMWRVQSAILRARAWFPDRSPAMARTTRTQISLLRLPRLASGQRRSGYDCTFYSCRIERARGRDRG